MFDLGFSEIVVIAVVLLVVVGPERLPGVARTAGHLLGRMQRYVAGVKADIQREMQLDELKKFREKAQSFEQDMRAGIDEIHSEVKSALSPVSETPAAAPVAQADAKPEPDAAPLLPAEVATPVAETPPPAAPDDGQLALDLDSPVDKA